MTMIKRFLEKFRRDAGKHRATVRLDFFPGDEVTVGLFWHQGPGGQEETVILAAYFYARILYELGELNQVRVARELMDFVDRVASLVKGEKETPTRTRLPLGRLRLTKGGGEEPPSRSYQGQFFELGEGAFRLDFMGSFGEESFYLPANFLVLLQYCMDNLKDEPLEKLARCLGRMHQYYRLRRDFWDGSSLSAAPVFGLGNEEIREEEAKEED
jgi:hypothetical protein